MVAAALPELVRQQPRKRANAWGAAGPAHSELGCLGKPEMSWVKALPGSTAQLPSAFLSAGGWLMLAIGGGSGGGLVPPGGGEGPGGGGEGPGGGGGGALPGRKGGGHSALPSAPVHSALVHRQSPERRKG